MNKTPSIPHHLIESFLAVVEAPTLQKAGDKLGLTQSALSRQMQLLEDLLPHKVFTFEGRKKVLTQYGRTLHGLLAPQFSQTQGLIEQASLLFSEPSQAHVKICGRGELLDSIADQLKFSGRVSFLNMDSTQALDAVMNRQCDIGVVYTAIDSPELVMRSFFTNRLRIVIPKILLKTKPSSKAELSARLQKLPCLLYKTEDATVENFLREYGLDIKTLNISRVYANYSALLKLINANQGWSVLPSNFKISEERYHVYQLSGRSQDERVFYLCFRRELRDATWFKELMAEFKNML